MDPTLAYGSTQIVTAYAEVQRVSLTDLEAGQQYHYRVSIEDYNHHGHVFSRDHTFE